MSIPMLIWLKKIPLKTDFMIVTVNLSELGFNYKKVRLQVLVTFDLYVKVISLCLATIANLHYCSLTKPIHILRKKHTIIISSHHIILFG